MNLFQSQKSSSAFDLEPADRLKKLPPYLFAEVDKKKRELIAQGKNVIDLGVGDPDIPTPSFIIESLSEAAKDPVNHRYALDAGMPVLRQSLQRWFQKRYNVKLDAASEILPLIGSKEGIAHLPLAVINPGDVVLVPDPCYPVYRSATWFAGGETVDVPLLEANGFLPDLRALPESVLKRAKMLYLNYPNNPTAAIANADFFKSIVAFAQKHNILIANDAAYNDIAYDDYRPSSLLEIPGAKDVCIEFHSLSKTFNMTGWRIGYVVGNAKAISLLAKVKANVDSGIFQAIQLAGVKALEEGDQALRANLKVYQSRRDLLVSGLNRLGWACPSPKATFYCWIPVPPGYTSAELAMKFLEEMHIIVTPGNGFGAHGEGYFRISLTVANDRLQEALQRIEKSHQHFHTKPTS